MAVFAKAAWSPSRKVSTWISASLSGGSVMSEARYRCGMEAALDLVGGKWKMLILYHIRTDRLRFSQLRRLIGSVSEKVLSQQLKEMVADGLLRRIDHQTLPPHVEYEITGFGADLCDTMQPMCEWGVRHMKVIEEVAVARAGSFKTA